MTSNIRGLSLSMREISDVVLATHFEDNANILRHTGEYLLGEDGKFITENPLNSWVAVLSTLRGRLFMVKYAPLQVNPGTLLADSMSQSRTFYANLSVPVDVLDRLQISITPEARVHKVTLLDIEMPFAQGKSGLDVAREYEREKDLTFGLAVSSKNLADDTNLGMLREAPWFYLRKPATALTEIATSAHIQERLAARRGLSTGKVAYVAGEQTVPSQGSSTTYALPKLIFNTLGHIVDGTLEPMNKHSLRKK